MPTVVLEWSRFPTLTAARAAFPFTSCVYAQTDAKGELLRVGRASKGLDVRYHGGTGGSLDAAMHQSGNLVFVAPVSFVMCVAVESELIWRERDRLSYNKEGKTWAPVTRIEIEHRGDSPRFADQQPTPQGGTP